MILQIEAVTVTRCSKTVVNIHNLTNLCTTINYFFKILYMMCFLDHNLFRRSTSVSWMMLFYILKKTNINKRTQSRFRSKIRADPLHYMVSNPGSCCWTYRPALLMVLDDNSNSAESCRVHCAPKGGQWTPNLLSSSINAFLELSGVCSQTSSF